MKEKVGFVDRVMGGTKLFLIGNDDDLRQLVENRKVETSPATRDEVVRLLASADTAVRDARLAGMSTTSRLDLA